MMVNPATNNCQWHFNRKPMNYYKKPFYSKLDIKEWWAFEHIYNNISEMIFCIGGEHLYNCYSNIAVTKAVLTFKSSV